MKKLLNRRSKSSVSGFTLVELLLAITLMSILLGLTYSGLRAATRSSERGEQLLAAGAELRVSHQFIRRQLNQMLPLPFAVTDDSEEIQIVFEGDANHIQYVAPMPGYLGTGGPQVQLIEIVNGDNGDVMLQFSHSLLLGFFEDRLYDREPVILLEGVKSADFEFLGKDEEGELIDWAITWEQFDVLPVAVRLNIELSEELNLIWPELVAGVRVDEQAVKGSVRSPSYEQSIRDMSKNRGQGDS
jgi:general secretion pathway protein J